MTLKGRVLFFIKEKGIKKSDFFEATSIAASNFKGDGLHSELGGDKIVKILTAYPEISSDWLLTGKGEMLKEDVGSISIGDHNKMQYVKGSHNTVTVADSKASSYSVEELLQENNDLKNGYKLLKNQISLKDKELQLKDREIELLNKTIEEKELTINLLLKLSETVK